MVAGHLREKNGIYQMILTYRCGDGQKDSTSISTGIRVTGAASTKRAERMLLNTRKNFVVPERKPDKKTKQNRVSCSEESTISSSQFFSKKKQQVLFCDFMKQWLELIRNTIDPTTYSGYYNVIYGQILPYFNTLELTLADIEDNPGYIQDYYNYKIEKCNLSTNTVIHHHANIRSALQYAFQIGLIEKNPADRVVRPKKNNFIPNYYNEEEIAELIEAFRGDPLELAVILGCYYGLRRSEIVGLKWKAIDFVHKTITIEHVVGQASINHKRQLIPKDKTKTKSSRRSLPLVGPIESVLVKLQRLQVHNRAVFGNAYCTDYLDYIYVNSQGELIKPDYITQHFPIVLKKNGLRHIRFHDTRHSCASLLYAHGVSMKEIQEWLGHSDISTTMNIYTHLNYQSKIASANAILSILPGQKKELLEAAN